LEKRTRMRMTSLYLDKKSEERLARMKEYRHEPMSVIIREAVRHYYEKMMKRGKL